MFEIIPNWHPLFVHFTVALFLVAVGLFVVSPWMKSPLKEQWQIVARWNLWLSAGITVITGLAGLYAYNTVAHDTPSHAAMTEHRNWAIVAITLILALAIWSVVRVRRNQSLGPLFVVALVITGGVVAATAWHGGEVVFRYGLGVMSLPKVEGEGHAHEHEGAAAHAPVSGVPISPMPTERPVQSTPPSNAIMPHEDSKMPADQETPPTHVDDGHAH